MSSIDWRFSIFTFILWNALVYFPNAVITMQSGPENQGARSLEPPTHARLNFSCSPQNNNDNSSTFLMRKFMESLKISRRVTMIKLVLLRLCLILSACKNVTSVSFFFWLCGLSFAYSISLRPPWGEETTYVLVLSSPFLSFKFPLSPVMTADFLGILSM